MATFFLTPFFSNVVVVSPYNLESLIFALFVVASLFSLFEFNLLLIFKNSAGACLIFSPLIVLGTFFIATLFTANLGFEFLAYFLGYALLFVSGYHFALTKKSISNWLIIAGIGAAFLTVSNTILDLNLNTLHNTEISMLLGFSGIIGLSNAGVKSFPRFSCLLLFLFCCSVQLSSNSVAGIISFLALNAVVVWTRLRASGVTFSARITTSGLLFLAVLPTLIFLKTNSDLSLWDAIRLKFVRHYEVGYIDPGDATIEVRLRIYALQWQIFLENIWVGIGLGQFKELNTLGHGSVAVVNHSNLLKCLSEGGIFTGVSYALMTICYAYHSIRSIFVKRFLIHYSDEMVAIACILIWLLVRGFAMDTLFLREFFVVVGLFAGRYAFENAKLEVQVGFKKHANTRGIVYPSARSNLRRN